KDGLVLAFGVMSSLVVMLSLWRYLKLTDINSTQSLDWHRLLSIIAFVGVIASGCYYNLSAPYTALFIQIALSLIVTTLFIVLNFDDKMLDHPRNKSIILRMNATENVQKVDVRRTRTPH